MKHRSLRILISLILTLSLIAAGGARGMAHAATTPAGGLTPLVICAADGGTTTIHLDQDGNAVDPAEHCPASDCPDCVLVVLAAGPLPAAWTGSRRRLNRRGLCAADEAPHSRHIARAKARAPPSPA